MIGNRCRSQQKTGFRVADPGGESKHRHEGAAGALYLSYRKQKYKVAVFHSGHEDLYQNTLELLRLNRRRSAARAVQKAKSTPER